MTDGDAPAPVAILLVEDDEVISGSVAMALEPYGYGVTSAGGGPTGLELFLEGRHNLLLDVMPPGLDGIGLDSAPQPGHSTETREAGPCPHQNPLTFIDHVLDDQRVHTRKHHMDTLVDVTHAMPCQRAISTLSHHRK